MPGKLVVYFVSGYCTSGIFFQPILIDGSVCLRVWQEGIRMLVSRDLDMSMSLYLQFNLMFGCHDDRSDVNTWRTLTDQQHRYHHHQQQQQQQSSVLVQFSNNAGISWQFLHEMHSTDHTPQQSK